MSLGDWLKPATELKQTVSGREFHTLTTLHSKTSSDELPFRVRKKCKATRRVATVYRSFNIAKSRWHPYLQGLNLARVECVPYVVLDGTIQRSPLDWDLVFVAYRQNQSLRQYELIVFSHCWLFLITSIISTNQPETSVYSKIRLTICYLCSVFLIKEN